MNRLLAAATAALTAAVCATTPVAAADRSTARWPQFRGPGGAGVAHGTQPAPVDFGPSQNVLWKTALPAGHSSPVVWGDRIFLTGFVEGEKKLETLCLDRSSGAILWRRAVSTDGIEKVHEVNNPAATTPATDGETVFVYFGSYGLVAYDFEGSSAATWPRPPR